jgi:nucleoporin GLE1
MGKVKAVLVQAAQMQQIMIDITPYIASVPPEKLQEGGNPQYPAALLFLLNHFAKAIMSQLAQEVSRDTLAADPIGILAVTMFSAPEFQYNGHSLIDVLWAKYHKVCPVLFGITGTEKSVAGRARLGWRVDGGSEVSPQEHYDHMTGFAAGFAAITLRDFSKSRNESPAPIHLFWTAMARIISTPNNEQTPTHYVVLYNMLKHSVPRFIGFYGLAAIAALRAACITFPSSGGPQSASGTGSDSTVLAVQALPHSWKKELNLTV